MKKLVLLSYYYPPSNAVGGLRAEKVVSAFRAAGHEVHVITARLPDEQSTFREREPGLTIETVKPWLSPRWWYVNLKRRLSVASTGEEPAPAATAAHAAREVSAPRLKRWLSALLWLPDDKQGFIPPAVRAGLRACRSEGDVLYTTVPPFSTHLAGLVLHKLTGMRWVAEFRDPWTDSHFRTANQRSRWTNAINRWLERQCLSAAALVVSVTEGIQLGLMTKVPGKAQPEGFIVVRNGIPRLNLEARRSTSRKPFRVLYVGTFYHRRDPFPFLEGLASLIRESALNIGDISVEFVGSCIEYRGSSVEARVRQLGLEPFVTIRSWVPYAEAQRLIAAADLLLLLAQDQPAQVPNKLYDYLAAGVPILAFTDAQGESARMLGQIGGHFLISWEDPVGVREAIRSAMLSAGQRAAGNPDLLLEWTTERQMAKLVAAVDLFSEGTPDVHSRSVAKGPTA